MTIKSIEQNAPIGCYHINVRNVAGDVVLQITETSYSDGDRYLSAEEAEGFAVQAERIDYLVGWNLLKIGKKFGVEMP